MRKMKSPAQPGSESKSDASLLPFFLLAYAIAWALWVPLILSFQGVLPVSLPISLAIPGLLAPSVAAVVMTWVARGSLRGLVSPLRRWQFGLRWYGFALLSTVALVLLALVFSTAITAIPVELASLLPWYVVLGFFLVGSVAVLAEEIGWRGYALPRLLEYRSALSSAVILGIIWAGWHIPLYFLPLAIVPGTQPTDAPVLAILAVNSLSQVAGSILITWLFVSTGRSLLIVALYHSAYNSAVYWVLPALGGSAFLAFYGVLTALLWAVAAAVIIIAGPRHLSRRGSARTVAD